MTRRAVITGGAGFLGSHLCERLLQDGWHVHCLDNFLTGRPENITHLSEHPGNPHELPMIDLAFWIRDLHSSSSPIMFTPLPLDDPRVEVGEGRKRTIAWFSGPTVTNRPLTAARSTWN